MAIKPSRVGFNLLLFLFTFSIVLLHMVKGDLCFEDLNGCDPQCQTRCETKHPGGHASCDAATSLCKCFYQCGPPTVPPSLPTVQPSPPKGETCNVGIFLCGGDCNHPCCNSKCAERFPGEYCGHGSCQSSYGLPVRPCLCIYQC